MFQSREQKTKRCGGFAILVLMAMALGYELRTPQFQPSIYSSKFRSTSGALATGPLTPHGKVIEGVELFYMLPSTPQISGILVFFHGCSHGGQDFFLLPEDRIVALESLNRGLAIVSPTSVDRATGCWNEADVNLMSKALPAFGRELGLPANLPLMGMGASSGGAFLFSVYQKVPLKSMVSYIMGRGFDDSDIAGGGLPATAYVHMPRDERTAKAVADNVATLKAANIPTKEWTVQPHPFTPELCDKRLPELGDRRCHAFINLVKNKHKGLLDKDNTILKSYTRGEWKAVMQDSKFDQATRNMSSTKKNLVKPGQLSPYSRGGHGWLWASVEEEIAVSYAQHEMTAEHRGEVLEFLMAHAGISNKKPTK
jgi:hypothetical protein